MCACAGECVSVCVWEESVSVWVCASECVWVCVPERVCLCVRAQVCECMSVCACSSVWVCVRARVCLTFRSEFKTLLFADSSFVVWVHVSVDVAAAGSSHWHRLSGHHASDRHGVHLHTHTRSDELFLRLRLSLLRWSRTCPPLRRSQPATMIPAISSSLYL